MYYIIVVLFFIKIFSEKLEKEKYETILKPMKTKLFATLKNVQLLRPNTQMKLKKIKRKKT